MSYEIETVRTVRSPDDEERISLNVQDGTIRVLFFDSDREISTLWLAPTQAQRLAEAILATLREMGHE